MTLKTFNKTGGQNFGVAGNWTPNGVPGSSDDAEIDSGAVVDLTSLASINSIGVGSGNTLDIENAGLSVLDGTGPNKNSGLIAVSSSSNLAISGGTFNNSETIALMGSSDTNVAELLIDGSGVSLDGGGTVEMSIGGGPSANFFGNGSQTTVYTFINVDDTISGDGNVGGGLDFTNDGTIETNNTTGSSGGTLQITTNSAFLHGQFTNNGLVRADDGGTLIFGSGGTQVFDNERNITLEGNTHTTKLEIDGNVTFQASGHGAINLLGSEADEIVSNGQPATLTLSNQTIKGAGTIGDSNLTLDNVSGTIEADISGETLLIGGLTAGPGINNSVGGTLGATNGGTLEDLFSNINNAGTITATAGGGVALGAAVSGSGAIDIGTASYVILLSTVAGNVTFTGAGAILYIGNNPVNGGIGGQILGAVGSDLIDLAYTPYAASNSVSWEQISASGGVLSLLNSSGQTIESLNMAGTFTSANFALSSDGDVPAGTLITVQNAPPPSGTTADMIMNDGSGDFEIYDLGNNAILAGYAAGAVGSPWQVEGVGGFDGSDTSDVMMRNGSTGAFLICDVSNNTIINQIGMGQVGLEWMVSGFGDFSGNAHETDMLMRNSSTGQFEVYDISNNQIAFATSMGQVGTAWQVAGFGDFSGHAGETGDMLMRNSSTGQFEVYDIANNTITFATSMGQVGLEWTVAGFGDFSGNANETDMLMRNSNTGAFEIYDINNNAIYNDASMGQVGLEWQVMGFGPIDGAGTSDMLMRNTSTGAFELYDIANNQLVGATSMGQVGTGWSVAGIAADPPTAPPSQLAQAMASYASSSASDPNAPLQQPAPVDLTAPTVLTASQA